MKKAQQCEEERNELGSHAATIVLHRVLVEAARRQGFHRLQHRGNGTRARSIMAPGWIMIGLSAYAVDG